MRLHKLKMNPAKCVFGVQAGDFLGFIVHQRGIEVPEDKASAVINASPPRTKKELQRLLGQNEFVWEPKHQEAFDKIKAYLESPPVLVPLRAGFPLKLYISAAEASIGNTARFRVQCGQYQNDDILKCRIFGTSLSGATFRWFSKLRPGTVADWPAMEKLFRETFGAIEPEVDLASLTQMSQQPTESAVAYLQRFQIQKAKLNNSRISHIFRECNMTADALAKMSIEHAPGLIMFEDPPAHAVQAFLDDLDGVSRPRRTGNTVIS
ncbi:uncharacterized protein LOC121050646 [Rosa chinensis]|uniref:uncharacterized protein LOC121050646 n=1 Tax=Rosa chinensis TaxID=74649 RepID=UPI001AD936E6|nr:uncharacterized protein LOC121050646 [Rosa chinensis]